MKPTHTPEQWRPVLGFEGIYEVSNLGRVRSLDRIVPYKDGRTRPAKGILRRQTLSAASGRHQVSLGFGVNREVHVLVAEAFHGPRPAGLEVCHNDGDAQNNRADNLRWDTRESNVADQLRHGTHANAAKTHCPQGHEYTPENTYHRITTAGFNQRTCWTCKREQKRQARANGATW